MLTIAEIIAKAALLEGLDVKQAELHGLAQRGGSLECHLRIGKKVYSPLVRRGGADFIISLELLEALRACYYADKNKTTILVNDKLFSPYPMSPGKIERKKVVSDLKNFAKKLKLVPADAMLRKINKDTAMINILMLSFAVAGKHLSINKKNISQSIIMKINPKFLSVNQEIFQMAFNAKSNEK